MDIYQIVMLALVIANVIAIPIVKDLYNKQAATRQELSDYKLHVSEKYVSEDRHKGDLDRIEKVLDEIKDAVTKLADKQ